MSYVITLDDNCTGKPNLCRPNKELPAVITEGTLSDNQHSFHWKRPTDFTFTVRQLLEKHCEYGKDMVKLKYNNCIT
jgi:hypothetical protein